MPPETVRIVLDIQVDGDAIVGHTRVGASAPKPFSGWFGLMGALDTILESGPVTAGAGDGNVKGLGGNDVVCGQGLGEADPGSALTGGRSRP